MRSVIVGVDGSDAAKDALRWAIDEARCRDARLTAVLIAEPAYLYGGELPLSVDWDHTLARARDELAQVVEEVTEDLDDDTIEQRIESGDPRRVLRDLSRNADLLIVGSRGHGQLGGLLLGSVSQYLVTHAECPVTVVRPAAHHA